MLLPRDLGSIAARSTRNPIGQQAALASDYLDFAVGNPHLVDHLWWHVARTRPLPTWVAGALCNKALSQEQIAHLLGDRRRGVAERVLQTQELRGAAAELAVARAGVNHRLLAELAVSDISVEAASAALTSASSHHQARVLPAAARRLPASLIAHVVADPRISPSRLMWGALDRVADAGPDVTAALVTALATDPRRSVTVRTTLMSHVMASRYLHPDAWQALEPLTGADPSWTSGRARLTACIAGNPNTSRDGAAWATGWLTRHARRNSTLPTYVIKDITRVITARELDLTPVTGDWDAPTRDEAVTLKELRLGGLPWQEPWMRPHPRAVVSQSAVADEPFDIGEAPADAPPYDTFGQRRWWTTGMADHAGPWVDTQMRNADLDTWGTLYALAPGWAGTCSELIAAARAL